MQEEKEKYSRKGDEDKPIFVNNAQRVIEGIKQEKATGVRWLAMHQRTNQQNFMVSRFAIPWG